MVDAFDDLDLLTVFNLAHDAGLTTAMVVGRERFKHLAQEEIDPLADSRLGREIEGLLVIYDTAATIAWALRLDRPADWQGGWVWEAFVP